MSRTGLICLAAFVLVAAALRLSGLDTELWFDELVSVRSASTFRALWADHTDNKHHLVWAWIWLAGPGRAGWVYRLPSVSAGLAVPPLMWAVARRAFGRPAGWVALVLATFCFPLVFYSSEARGYALVTLAAVGAYAAAPRVGRVPSARGAVAFNLLVVAGFLSHLTFAGVYAGLLAWAAVDVVRRPRWATTALAYHGPAAVAVAGLWWVDVSRITFAGGPPTSAGTVLRYLAAMAVGTPTDGVSPWVTVAAVAAVCGVGLAVVGRRQGGGAVAFFTVALVVAPVVLTLTRRTPYLAVRYYLVDVPLVLLLTAAAAAARARVAVWIVTAAVVVQGLLGTWELRQWGRGDVRAALAHMAAAGPVTVGSDRPAMDRLCVDFYGGPGLFVDAPGVPRWWVFDLDDPLVRGPDTIQRRGRTYRLDAAYPSDPTSGLTWDVYRLDDPS